MARKKTNSWVVVLAAGEGTRLQALTADPNGRSVPKQFCSLKGETSLLQDTLRRAEALVPTERVVVVVAEQHRHWWEPELAHLPPGNVMVQPQNKGTAAGVLLPLLSILARDPDASIAYLPSDHFVGDESVLTGQIQRALTRTDKRPEGLILLGMVPDHPDAGLGWVVPSAQGDTGLFRVMQFIEKPPVRFIPVLLRNGGLVSSFIFAATAKALLALYHRRLPGLLSGLRRALGNGRRIRNEREALIRAYGELVTGFDFCRDLLEGAEDTLWVLPVPACGWSDLGTPVSLTRCIERNAGASAPGLHPPGRQHPSASPVPSRAVP